MEIRSVDANRYGKEIKRIDMEKNRSDRNDKRWNSMESNRRKEN